MLNQMMPKKKIKLPNLRDYQQEANALVRKHRKEGVLKVLVCQPTGSGKTINAGDLIFEEVEAGGRVLVVADRKKLVRQFALSLEENFGLSCGIIMAGERDAGERVVCAERVSMCNCIADGKFHPEEFTLIVFEEAHLALGASFQKIASHFAKSFIVGLTATPRASKQRSLMTFFDVMIETRTIKQLIEQRHLAKLTIKNIPITINIENSTKAGDYTEEDCAHAIEPYFERLAQSVAEHGTGKCSLVYLPLIEISKKFTAMLCGLGMKAAHVDGDMKEKDQLKIQRQLEMGEIDCVCCSMLWTVGIDIRPVNMICNLRLTTSWVLFVQICGRGTRTFDPVIHGPKGTKWGLKDDCILLDPLWNCENHSLLQRPACLVASSDEEAEEIDEEIKKQIASGGEADMMKAAESVHDARMEKLRERLERLAKRKSRLVDACEFFLKQGDLAGAEYEPIARWQQEAITQGQRNILIGHEIDLASVKDKGQATMIIDQILARSHKGLAPAKQCKQAESMGLPNAYNLPKEVVSGYLTARRTGADPWSGLLEIP